jgi:hypothetical protein
VISSSARSCLAPYANHTPAPLRPASGPTLAPSLRRGSAKGGSSGQLLSASQVGPPEDSREAGQTVCYSTIRTASMSQPFLEPSQPRTQPSRFRKHRPPHRRDDGKAYMVELFSGSARRDIRQPRISGRGDRSPHPHFLEPRSRPLDRQLFGMEPVEASPRKMGHCPVMGQVVQWPASPPKGRKRPPPHVFNRDYRLHYLRRVARRLPGGGRVMGSMAKGGLRVKALCENPAAARVCLLVSPLSPPPPPGRGRRGRLVSGESVWLGCYRVTISA